MSKTDYDLQKRKQSIAEKFMQEDFSKQNEEYLRSIQPEVDLEIDPPPPELCLNNIFLGGPFSPLEAKIFSATRVGVWKGINVEMDYFSSILADTDPQVVHECLNVAAGVSESVDKSSLTASQMTLMPKIHGFASLMALIFRDDETTLLPNIRADLIAKIESYYKAFECALKLTWIPSIMFGFNLTKRM